MSRISRAQWEARRQDEIERLEAEARSHESTAEMLYQRAALLEEQTFEEYLAEHGYAEWKSDREVVT